MNKKTALAALFVLILCFAIAQQVQAQDITDYQPGVSEGNIFKYDMVFYWSSTNPTATTPTSWVNANATEYYHATIKLVTGTTVTIDTLWRFLNGTETTNTELTDVAIGAGGSILVYATNLAAGMQLYPSSTSITDRIDETITRSYPQGARETNHIEENKTNVENQVYSYINLYFDKQTGVMVEVYTEDVYTSMPDQKFSRTAKIKESSLWTVSGSSSNGNSDGTTPPPTQWPMEIIYVITIVVVAVVVAASILLVRKRKAKKR